MEYIENLEWEKLYKEKKYKEAVEALNHEMAVNLLRVHNLYSDVKYDPEKKEYIAYGTPLYAKNSKNEFISEIEEFCDLSYELDERDIGIERAENIDVQIIEYNLARILRNKVKKTFKKYRKKFEKRI